MQAEHGTGESQASLTGAERATLLQALPEDILDPVRAAVDKAAGTDAEVRELPIIRTVIQLAIGASGVWTGDLFALLCLATPHCRPEPSNSPICSLCGLQDLHEALCTAAGTAGIRLQPYKPHIGHQLLKVAHVPGSPCAPALQAAAVYLLIALRALPGSFLELFKARPALNSMRCRTTAKTLPASWRRKRMLLLLSAWQCPSFSHRSATCCLPARFGWRRSRHAASC